jgi:hypothetical protein
MARRQISLTSSQDDGVAVRRMCPFMPFSGGNRAEIPQKKIFDRQADRFDSDLGQKKHKNRLSERPQICRQKNQKTRQTSRQTVSRFGFLGHSNQDTLAMRGLEEPFFQLCCCVSFLLWREIGFGFT